MWSAPRAANRVFLNPNTFVYDAESGIFCFHTAGRDRTRSNIEQSEQITIVVYEIGRLLPAPIITDYKGSERDGASVSITTESSRCAELLADATIRSPPDP